MPTTRKRSTRSARTADQVHAVAESGFVRVVHSEALHARTLCVLAAVDEADDATAHRDEFGAVIIELTGSALDYCFMQPLKLAKPGFVLEQSASLGLVGVQQLIGRVVRQVIGHMNSEQLRSVSGSIRRLMV